MALPVLPNPHDPLTPEEISRFTRFHCIENILTSDQCDELVAWGREHVKPATVKHIYKNNLRLEHCFLPSDHPLHKIIEPLWQEAISYFGFDVTYIEPYKLQRYLGGGFFERHIDNYHGTAEPTDRKLSATIQLSDERGYKGGELMIGSHLASRRKGSITFFPSFYPHSVREILGGERWVVVAWAWGPYWK